MAPTWNLPPLRPGRPAGEPLAARRAAIPAGDQRVPDGVQVAHGELGGVGVIEVTAPTPAREIVYFHGGGYRLGSAAGWVGFAGRIAQAAGARVTLVDYRLAPEHPFPAAVHDAAGAYAARRGNACGPVLAGGDSAGGGLAAALAVACRRDRVPLPAGLVLLSPWLDLTLAAAAEDRAGTDILFPPVSAAEAVETYLQGAPATDPLASPLLATNDELAAFPPVLLFASTIEILVGDALALTKRLADVGVDTTLHLRAGVNHAWPAIFADLPQTAEAIEAIGAFSRARG